jgi:S1-C subfamily serine protease
VNDLPKFSTNTYVRVFPENILVPTTIIGVNYKADLALLKIDLISNSLSPRSTLLFGNSRQVKKGSSVMTLGQTNITLPILIDFNPDVNAIIFNQINNRTPLFGIVRDNKWCHQTDFRESISTDYLIPVASFGGPTINLLNQVIGVASWNSDIANTDIDGEYFSTKGSIASVIAKPVVDYFLSLPNGTTGAIYPVGFFGIAYDYYTAELNIRDFAINNNIAPYDIIGIQIIESSPGNLVDAIRNDTLKDFGFYLNPISSTNPYPSSPAANLGLEVGDIIIAAAKSGDTLEYIGNTDTGVPFDTIVHLATNTGMIDIQYLKKSEDWQNIHTVTNIGLTGIPNIINHPLNRFT